MWVEHPLIKPEKVEVREYQINIARSCLNRNTLIVLGTGLGKTIIVTIVIAEVLYKKGGKVLFLAPTKPLVEQHYKTLQDVLNVDSKKIVMFTGEVSKEKRKVLWKDSLVVVSTPQVIENDLKDGLIDVESLTLVVFDEAHRAVGKYSYVFIAEKLKRETKIVGMTASPGWSEERIMEVVKNLKIENIEVRTENDPDVRSYVNPINIKVIRVRMPEELSEIYDTLKQLYDEIVGKIRDEYGIFSYRRVGRKDLLEAQELIEKEIAAGKSEFYNALTLLTAAIKVDYALEHLETQGFKSFLNFMEKIVIEGNDKAGSKAARMLIFNSKFIKAYNKAKEFAKKSEESHPKLAQLCEILKNFYKENPQARAIVFTHYRDTARVVVEALNRQPGIRAERFVGQATRDGDKGLRQKEQIEIIDRFRRGELNVLVATSVGEEGLDIPQVDLVVFYEAVPSEIRAIQRRGRTGRKKVGNVYVLTTERTRDEAYLFASKYKEKIMKKRIELLKEKLGLIVSSSKIAESANVSSGLSATNIDEGKSLSVENSGLVKDQNTEVLFSSQIGDKQRRRGQLLLTDFLCNGQPFVLVVNRKEAENEVVKYLIDRGNRVDLAFLEVGDYIISNRMAIKRIVVRDSLRSSEVEALLKEIRLMKEKYSNCVVIIERNGNESFSGDEIIEIIATLIRFKVNVVVTHSYIETAKLIEILSKN